MEETEFSDFENNLIDKIKGFDRTGEITTTKLETDEKVLARVTDGIYRLPGSAIRELISNAYDADAENVIIETDAPRFESMSIRDDGNGMSVETLVNLINHIGGSAKRSNKGKSLKVTDTEDDTLSHKKKRKLIGKIGIGLFSVAQLTRDFEIITKQEGTDFYLRAKIVLYNHSDELKTFNSERGASFQTGDVEIWTEKTNNTSAHGTDIILHNIKDSAKSLLKSIDIWGQKSMETDPDSDQDNDDENGFLDSSKLQLPNFHIGNLTGEEGYEHFRKDLESKPNLPWSDGDTPNIKFSKLYDAVLELTNNRTNPKLNMVLDNYLNMIWTLALSVPLDYIEKHPFDLSLDEIPSTYIISNKSKGQVYELTDANKKIPFSDYIKFGKSPENVGFNVVVDGIKLYRPIRFTNLPESTAKIKKPILFLGSYSPNLSDMDIKDSAGSLAFDAYIHWSPKVVPKDHNGVLVRLHNASGIMFDETFMKHQVAEHTIKSQLSAEIFVHKGLDSALNIDRESFNISHPHYQIVMRWLHEAIRQVVNKYKNLKKQAIASNRSSAQSDFARKLSDHVDSRLTEYGLDPSEKPSLEILTDEKEKKSDSFSISKKDFTASTGIKNTSTLKSQTIEARAEAIFQVLDAHGLLQNLAPNRQKDLLTDVLKVLSTD